MEGSSGRHVGDRSHLSGGTEGPIFRSVHHSKPRGTTITITEYRALARLKVPGTELFIFSLSFFFF